MFKSKLPGVMGRWHLARLLTPSLAGVVFACGGRGGVPVDEDVRCATDGVPDRVEGARAPFEDAFDTGVEDAGDYGQAACPGRYLFELDVEDTSGVFLLGAWSMAVPREPCDYRASLDLFGQRLRDGSWERTARVLTESHGSGAGCEVQLVSRSGPLPPDANAEAAYGYAAPGRYAKMRAAVRATNHDGARVPIYMHYYWPTLAPE